MEIRFAIGDCSLGSILVAATDRGVCAILLGSDADVIVRGLRDGFPEARLIADDEMLEHALAKAISLVETPAAGFDLPLDLHGTEFQRRVWQALTAIPAGATASYTDIARSIGSPKAVRAVAGACAANRLAVAIPCHRAVRNDGGLAGYRWGVARKAELLRRESESVKTR